MFVAFEGFDHLVNKVVDIEKIHLDASVVHLDREIVRDVIAESRNCRVVVRTAPLSEKVREAVYKNLGSCLLAVFEHQFLSSFLALAVFACTETTCESGLNRAGDHYRAVVAILLEGIKKH